MASRLRSVHVAVRPKMFGRAMISGPSGAGKTWTGLSIATYLVAFEHFLAAGGNPDEIEPGDIDISTVEPHEILVIDTEKESALTYADVFKFSHLPWRPPFDPSELKDTLEELEQQPPPLVTFVDSFSKFWHGQGGTLDIAGGAIGGWKHARPLQEALVEQILASSTHIILGVRSKMEYLIEGGKTNQTVHKLGLNPMQDDNLVYEMNIAVDIDMEHQVTVTKSRTPAVPVGRMYPAGLERKLAEDYADWLAGGVPPANRQDVESIVERFSGISSKDDKIAVKTDFVERFGMPHSLTADRVPLANQWLDERLAELDDSVGGRDDPGSQSPTTGDEPAQDSAGNDDETAQDPSESDETPVEAPQDQTPPGSKPARPSGKKTGKPEPEVVDAAAEESPADPTDTEKTGSVDNSGGGVEDRPVCVDCGEVGHEAVDCTVAPADDGPPHPADLDGQQSLVD